MQNIALIEQKEIFSMAKEKKVLTLDEVIKNINKEAGTAIVGYVFLKESM